MRKNQKVKHLSFSFPNEGMPVAAKFIITWRAVKDFFSSLFPRKKTLFFFRNGKTFVQNGLWRGISVQNLELFRKLFILCGNEEKWAGLFFF